MVESFFSLLRWVKAVSEIAQFDDLGKFDIPTLILLGDEDQIVPIARVLEPVATLDGFINANINAQVQGIPATDYKEGSLVKKGDLFFKSIRDHAKRHCPG